MSVFKKTCFNCGKKVDSLLEGNICSECYIENHPPIKEIKEVNLSICNECGRIHYSNALQTVEDIEEMLPKIMRDRIILNDGYIINSIEIKNFEVIRNKIQIY
jgi:NMD protein affecting ribosome stability and mRNA decay